MPENGKVKWFSNVKGYGFLQKDGEDRDIFVHYSAILSDGYKTLDSGEEVTFEISDSDKGPQAKNVIRVKKPPKEKPAEPVKKAEPEAKPEEAKKETEEKAAS